MKLEFAQVRCLPINRRQAFSMVEIMVALALIAILATLAIMSIVATPKGVSSAKLNADVTKLNQLIGIYKAQGGSLDGITSVQGVLDKLKTIRTSAESKRQAGMLTGRAVDVRLAARMQTAKEASASRSTIAVWNATTQQFELTSAGRQAGVTEFYLDESLASKDYGTDERLASNVLYNGSDGWVWATGDSGAIASLTPVDQTLNDMANSFDPVGNPSGTTSGGTTSGGTTSGGTSSGGTTSDGTTSGGTTSGGTTSGGTSSPASPVALPTPIITPPGGVYPLTLFPSLIYINPNGAPTGSSILQYRFNNGDWMNYSGPFSVPSGTKVESRNLTTNTALYSSSATNVQRYFYLVASFTGLVTAKWNPSVGTSSMRSTINNSNPDSISELNGTAASGGARNSFIFRRTASFSNVPPDVVFKIGQISYYNGTINSGTGADGLRLHLDITMTTPGVASTPADIDMTLINTVNTSDPWESADMCVLANPVTNYSIVLHGVTYTLVVKYGEISSSQGFVNGNTLGVFEDATGTVDILAVFVSSTPE